MHDTTEFNESSAASVQEVSLQPNKVSHYKRQQILNEKMRDNLRGLNTFNVLKKVVWACVIDRPKSGKVSSASEVNLSLLKALLTEI